LWRFSRHPNYFFEWLHWFAYVAFAYSSTHGWIALIGPISMYVFLRFITGVPHSERSSLKRRGDAYRTYQKTTNAFFPWIPTRQTD
jgi:steroid 5-alpha reductase family enzyme